MPPKSQKSSELIRIGDLAKKMSVTPRTLRYYEQIGLLTPTVMKSTGYRYYSVESILWLEKIRDLQSVGLSLAEIKEIMRLFQKEKTRAAAKKKMIIYMELHLKEIEQKILVLNKMKHDLIQHIRDTRRKLRQLSKNAS